MDTRRNFGIIIPQGVVTRPKATFFKIYKEFGYWHIKIRIPRYPRLLDWMLRPLCKYGGHRWRSTYNINSYVVQPYSEYIYHGSRTSVTEQHFQCARCKKTKVLTK